MLPGQSNLEQLLAVATDRMRDGCAPGERMIAVACVALGRAPVCGFAAGLWKVDFDESEHPRHPAGSARGGQCRPKDRAANQQEALQAATREQLISAVQRRALRQAIWSGLLFLLEVGGAGIVETVPLA